MPEALPTYVLDASIAIKWLLPFSDEPHLAKAEELARDYQDGLISLIAPFVLSYEVGHALVRAGRRGRISQDDVRDGYRRFLNWKIPLIHDHSVLQFAVTLTSTAPISFYDASYYSLALSRKSVMIHADERFQAAIINTSLDTSVAYLIADYLPEIRTSN